MRLYKGFMKSSSKYFQSNFQKFKTWLLLEHYFKWIITLLLRSSVWDCSCQDSRHLNDLHSLKYDSMTVRIPSEEGPDIFALLVSHLAYILFPLVWINLYVEISIFSCFSSKYYYTVSMSSRRGWIIGQLKPFHIVDCIHTSILVF